MAILARLTLLSADQPQVRAQVPHFLAELAFMSSFFSASESLGKYSFVAMQARVASLILCEQEFRRQRELANASQSRQQGQQQGDDAALPAAGLPTTSVIPRTVLDFLDTSLDEEQDDIDSEVTESGFSDTDDDPEDDLADPPEETPFSPEGEEAEHKESPPYLQDHQHLRGRVDYKWHKRTMRRRARLRRRLARDAAAAAAKENGAAGRHKKHKKSHKKHGKASASSSSDADSIKRNSARRSHFHYCLAGQWSENSAQQISQVLDSSGARRFQNSSGSSNPRWLNPISNVLRRTQRRRSQALAEQQDQQDQISASNAESQQPPPPNCEECSAVSAQVMCVSCTAPFCRACFERTHSGKVFSRHVSQPTES